MWRTDVHPSSATVDYLLANSMGCREQGSTVWQCLTFQHFTLWVFLQFPVSLCSRLETCISVVVAQRLYGLCRKQDDGVTELILNSSKVC